jgi:hypothetical protein
MQLETPSMNLEEIVRRAVDTHRGELERLVYARVMAVVDELVESELDARANSDVLPTRSTEPAAAKVCRSCHQEKPLDQFPPGRNACRGCRNRAGSASRKRRTAQQEPVPFAGATSTTSLSTDPGITSPELSPTS